MMPINRCGHVSFAWAVIWFAAGITSNREFELLANDIRAACADEVEAVLRVVLFHSESIIRFSWPIAVRRQRFASRDGLFPIGAAAGVRRTGH